MTDPAQRIVVSDANVLINLMHAGRLDICGNLPGLEFVVPDHVQEEITVPEQSAALDAAVAEGLFQIAAITEPKDITLFADLTVHLGRPLRPC